MENFLDEPVLLTRDDENNLHCPSNVCTHRGNVLVENACAENGIHCFCHGRRFAIDGKFLSMPEFESVENFPTEQDGLKSL